MIRTVTRIVALLVLMAVVVALPGISQPNPDHEAFFRKNTRLSKDPRGKLSA
jgi:hypothetical protein